MSLDTDTTTEEQLQPLEGELGAYVAEDTVDGASADDDGFAAGYQSAQADDYLERPDGAPAAGKTGDEGDDADDEGEQSAASSPAPAPATLIGGKWTPEQLEQRLAQIESLDKGQRNIAGQLGGLLQKVQGQGGRKITRDDLKKITAEFGAEYADALVEDLNALGLGGAGGVSQADIEQLVSARTEAQTRELAQVRVQMQRAEKREVLRAHPDADDHFAKQQADGTWEYGPKAQQFRAWLASQPAERQQEVATSWDADVMTSALSDFKKSASASSTSTASSAPAARTSRVARAVAQRGAGSSAQATEDPMLAGYLAAKGQR